MNSRVQTIRNTLFSPVDAASVAAFRIGFGLIMLLDSIRHIYYYPLHKIYVAPLLFFRFYGFEWVPILHEKVFAVYAVMAIASFGILLGKFYRSSVALVGIGIAWTFLQDQAVYLNHVYMLILYCVIMFFIPANRYWALDAKHAPEIASNTLPGWCRLLLVVQIEVILVWAGIVKLNPDWLQLVPLSAWLAIRHEMPFIGQLFVMPVVTAVAAYGVIALHLIGAPLLLFRKSRLYVLGLYGFFHLLNHFVFTIGVFPWVTFYASLICFEPDWPRRIWARIRRQSYAQPMLDSFSLPSVNKQMVIAALLGVWLTYQIGMPMRNWFYDGLVAWNEQGHRFSWRMKLRTKSGNAIFILYDPAANKGYMIEPDRYLVGKQARKMDCQPDMILQMAHYLRDHYAPNGKLIENVEIYVSSMCSLNYRKPQNLINPRTNLAKVERTLTGNSWITRLVEPLRPEAWRALTGEPESNIDAETAIEPEPSRAQ